MQSIRKMLDEQDIMVGLMVQQVCAPWLAKLYADAGADFVFIEGEHMLFNGADLGNFILSSRLCGLPVVAKSSYVDRGHVCSLLDAGVTGIQLPMAESAEQLEQVVSYTKFPPIGVRAAAPGTGNTNYEPVDTAAWLKQQDEETVVIAHIESRTGLDNVEEMMQVPGVDVMFVGTYDLSISLGYPGLYDHPEVIAAINKLIDTAEKHGKVTGMWTPSYEVAEPWIDRGMRFIITRSDVGFIAKGAVEFMKCFPGHGPRVAAGQGHV